MAYEKNLNPFVCEDNAEEEEEKEEKEEEETEGTEEITDDEGDDFIE